MLTAMSVMPARAYGLLSLPGDPAWAVVDVETSGLRPYQHRVLLVAVLTLDASGQLTEEFSTLLNPGCDPGSVHIHGLTPQRLRGAPTFEGGDGQGHIDRPVGDRAVANRNSAASEIPYKGQGVRVEAVTFLTGASAHASIALPSRSAARCARATSRDLRRCRKRAR